MGASAKSAEDAEAEQDNVDNGYPTLLSKKSRASTKSAEDSEAEQEHVEHFYPTLLSKKSRASVLSKKSRASAKSAEDAEAEQDNVEKGYPTLLSKKSRASTKSAEAEEKRWSEDGELYTKAEFIEFFGGTEEWDYAEKAQKSVATDAVGCDESK